MKIPIYIVDAFTQERFKGNAAAVVITQQWLSDTVMQSIAAENNLSETAFLVPAGENRWHIRWFSPLTEIDFCGHATLASAYVLFAGHTTAKTLTIAATAVGEMVIVQQDDGRIQMDFPNRLPQVVKKVPAALLDGLSKTPLEVLKNNQAYFAIYPRESDIVKLTTNSEYLKRLAPYDTVVTALGDACDFVSRYFWPANGGDEDPVTGSIHTGLAPYWAEKIGKKTLIARQLSARTGTVYCKVAGERVFISGYAAPYLQGVIEL